MALVEVGKGRHGHTVRLQFCDRCIHEKLFPNQLHPTLWKDGNRRLCEFHMIMEGKKEITPQFMEAVARAKRLAEEEEKKRAALHIDGIFDGVDVAGIGGVETVRDSSGGAGSQSQGDHEVSSVE